MDLLTKAKFEMKTYGGTYFKTSKQLIAEIERLRSVLGKVKGKVNE